MSNKSWKLAAAHYHWSRVYSFGLVIDYEPDPWVVNAVIVCVSFAHHAWELYVQRRSAMPCLTKPGRPSSEG